MSNFPENLGIEIAFLSLLGFLYYLYQKKKIIHYESNKKEIIMKYILQSCLAERGDVAHVELDNIIESIDDYLQKRTTMIPISQLKLFTESSECSPELKSIIEQELAELGQNEQ